MSEWATYTISEACKRFSSGKGIAASQIFEIGAYPVFGGNGIRGYTDTYNFEGECAIIGRQGAYCGNTKYFCGKAYMTEHAIVATANDEHNIGYIANLLSMMNLGQYQGQSAQPGLSVNTLSNIELKLPDKETQDSIFSLLSALDKKIALNKQINARLEEMAKTLYDYWFVQFDFPDANGKPYKSSGGEMVFDETLKREIPKGWEVKSLGEVISLERGVTYSKDSICNDENGTGVLRATNISGNNIDLNDLIYISGEIDTQQKLKPFDILIVMSSGSKEHIGKNGVYYFEQDNAFGAFCSKITPQKVFFEFVSIFLQSNNFRNYVKNQCLGTNINNLNNSHILHCPIVRPNDEYIEAFHRQTKLIYEKISCNVKQNYHLTQLRDFLLPMLMNGQVSVAE